MERNYYEWLEINEKASQEIVEKAYKTLAKKYHPDLQSDENKKQAEEVFKKINNAYQIISDPIKREEYDRELEAKRQIEMQRQQRINNQTNTVASGPKAEEPNIVKRQIKNPQDVYRQQAEEYQEQINRAVEKAYKDAYVKDLQMRGYRVREKKTIKDYAKGLLSILILLAILILIFQIPLVKNYFINLYETNSMIKLVVDAIFNIFN